LEGRGTGRKTTNRKRGMLRTGRKKAIVLSNSKLADSEGGVRVARISSCQQGGGVGGPLIEKNGRGRRKRYGYCVGNAAQDGRRYRPIAGMRRPYQLLAKVYR